VASFGSFEEIEAWQKGRVLVNELYQISGRKVFSRDSGLRDQLRRAGVSIISNIAEGFERGRPAEFLQFLTAAKGSAGEVRAQLYIALDQGYIDKREFDLLCRLVSDISRMLYGLMQYLRDSCQNTKKSR